MTQPPVDRPENTTGDANGGGTPELDPQVSKSDPALPGPRTGDSEAPNQANSSAFPSDDVAAKRPPRVAPTEPPRDIGQVRSTDWERRPLPIVQGSREERFQAVVRQSVLNRIHRHGLSVEEIEVCGVLIGNVYHDDKGPWLSIEHAIEGNHAAGRATQVTFTAETWASIQSVMDRDFPEARVLGWYHTHPGFGIFLSDMDVFIQENFFAEAWQVAVVYDPKSAEQGLFLWKQGKPDVEPFLVENDETPALPVTVVNKSRPVPSTGAGGDVAVLAQRLEAMEKRQKWILVLLVVVTILSLIWPVVVSTYFPGFLKRHTQPPPPVQLPDEDDPASRSKLDLK